MKRSLIVAVLALAFLLIVAMKVDDRAPLGANVQIGPSTGDPFQLLRRATPDTYTCRAFVHYANDPTESFAALELVVAPGHHETKSLKARGLDVTFTVGVSKASDRAVTQVTAKRGGDQYVLNQRSEVELRPPGRTIVPLK